MIAGRVAVRVVWPGEPCRIGYTVGALASGAALIVAMIEVDHF